MTRTCLIQWSPMPRIHAKEMRRKVREQDALARTGARAARHVMKAIQVAAVGAFDQDGTFDAEAIVTPRMAVMLPLATDSLVAAFLQGYWRARLTAYQRRGVPMPVPPVALSAYTETIKHFKTRAGWTDVQLAELESRYRGVATGMIDGASASVSRSLDTTLRHVRELDLNKRDALKLFKHKVARNGPTQVRSSVVETMFRTQTAMAHSVGQQRANADPDIDSILWGYEYFTVGDDRVRPAHAAMDGVRAAKDDPLWDQWWSPSGWSCRCGQVEIFKGDKLATPKPPPATTVDDVTGKTVPVVPDKGWAFNPAKVGPAPPSPMSPVAPIAPTPKPLPVTQQPTLRSEQWRKNAPGFKSAKTLAGAEQWAKKNIPGMERVNFGAIDLDVANDLNHAAYRVSTRYRLSVHAIVPMDEIYPTHVAPMAASNEGIGFRFAYWYGQGKRNTVTYLKTAGGTAGASNSAYRYAMHEMGHVVHTQTPRTMAVVKQEAMAYRAKMGEAGVRKQLGAYAWEGSAIDPTGQWKETWSQAFSVYETRKADLPKAARDMVENVLAEVWPYLLD